MLRHTHRILRTRIAISETLAILCRTFLRTFAAFDRSAESIAEYNATRAGYRSPRLRRASEVTAEREQYGMASFTAPMSAFDGADGSGRGIVGKNCRSVKSRCVSVVAVVDDLACLCGRAELAASVVVVCTSSAVVNKDAVGAIDADREDVVLECDRLDFRIEAS